MWVQPVSIVRRWKLQGDYGLGVFLAAAQYIALVTDALQYQ